MVIEQSEVFQLERLDACKVAPFRLVYLLGESCICLTILSGHEEAFQCRLSGCGARDRYPTCMSKDILETRFLPD